MRPAWLEINLDAIAQNLNATRRIVGPQVGLIAIVKGNAYGHGLVEVATRLAAEAPLMLAVAILEEALALREAGITTPVLVLGAAPADAAECFVAHGITPAVSEVGFAEALQAAAVKLGRTAHAHVKIDTGMGRQGCLWRESDELFGALSQQAGISVDGIFTHFACSSDAAVTAEQAECYLGAVARAEAMWGRRIPIKHAAASTPIVLRQEMHLNAVRPGIMLYGAGFDETTLARLGLVPTLALKARVAGVKTLQPGDCVGYGHTWQAERESRVALLPIGYCDGYPRALSGNAEVLLGGRRVPVVGLISMDCVVVDVTDVPAVQIGDEAVLIGTQGAASSSSAARISVDEVAARAKTVPQEILARLGPRLPRVYT